MLYVFYFSTSIFLEYYKNIPRVISKTLSFLIILKLDLKTLLHKFKSILLNPTNKPYTYFSVMDRKDISEDSRSGALKPQPVGVRPSRVLGWEFVGASWGCP